MHEGTHNHILRADRALYWRPELLSDLIPVVTVTVRSMAQSLLPPPKAKVMSCIPHVRDNTARPAYMHEIGTCKPFRYMEFAGSVELRVPNVAESTSQDTTTIIDNHLLPLCFKSARSKLWLDLEPMQICPRSQISDLFSWLMN